jgi:hypothetical protein
MRSSKWTQQKKVQFPRSRGIVMPIPAELRFHGGTKHARRKFWACGIDPDLLPEVRRS